MAFTVTSSLDQDSALITLSGEFDAESAPAFRKEIARLGGAKITSLRIVLTDVTFVASAGLGALIEAYRTLGPEATLTIVDAQGPVLETLEKTGLARRMRLVQSHT